MKPAERRHAMRHVPIGTLDSPIADVPGSREQAIAYYLTAYATTLTIGGNRYHFGARSVFHIARARQTKIDARSQRPNR